MGTAAVKAFAACGLQERACDPVDQESAPHNLIRSGVLMNSLIYNCLFDAGIQGGDAEAGLEYCDWATRHRKVRTVGQSHDLPADRRRERLDGFNQFVIAMKASFAQMALEESWPRLFSGSPVATPFC